MVLAMVHEAALELAVMGTGLHVEEKLLPGNGMPSAQHPHCRVKLIFHRMEPNWGKKWHRVGPAWLVVTSSPWENLSSLGDRKKEVPAWREDLGGLVSGEL